MSYRIIIMMNNYDLTSNNACAYVRVCTDDYDVTVTAKIPKFLLHTYFWRIEASP